MQKFIEHNHMHCILVNYIVYYVLIIITNVCDIPSYHNVSCN